jgi:pyrroloquinoline-quinone synthase
VIPLYNHRYHGRLYVVCPDPGWRQKLAEVSYEEATGRLFAGGVPHYELYLRAGEAMGISREEIYGTELCAGAIAFRAYFEYICGKSFLEGVSAHMLAAEAQVPGVSGKVGRALMQRFGLSEHDVAFFTVHDDADKEHSNIGRVLLDQFAKTDDDLRLVVATVRETIDIAALLYDEIYRCVQAVK